MRSPIRLELRSPVLAAAATALILAAACDPGQLADPDGEASLTIVPDSVTLTHIGQRFTFSAQLTGDPGPGSIRWEAPDLNWVYTLDSDGTVTARDNGQAQLWAEFIKSSEYGKLVAMATVRVEQVARVVEVLGSDQRAAAGLALPEPVGVRMLDAGGTPVRSTAVRFEVAAGGGRVVPEEVTSDSAGLASAVWTLGPEPGRQTLVAWAGGASAEIAAAALERDAAVDTVEVESDAGQWELAGKALPDPVVVRVSDEHGRAIPGATIRFEPGPGSGRVDPGTARSDSSGLASTVWTLGPEPGPMRLVVSAGEARTEIEATAVSDEGVCARTPAVSASIVTRVRWTFEISSCAEVTEEHLTEVTALGLEGQGIRRLWSGDFADLPNLERIGLDSNQLTELPPDIFGGLARLQELSLSDNKLSKLPSDIFAGLSSLEVLLLYGNRLTELPPDIFTGLASLRTLWLAFNELTALPPGVFDGLTALQLLVLSGNQLSELPPGIFDDLLGLGDLYVNDNQLASLPVEIFAGVPKLETLWVYGNRLTELPAGLFNGLSNLERLHLHENDLGRLPPGIFDGLSSLERVDLYENRLTALPPGIFDELSKLTKLRLDANRLAELPQGVFRGLSSLEELWLEGNRLTELLRGIFVGLSSLVYADMRYNPGEPFPVNARLERADTHDLLAPQPASVVMRVPGGAPFAFRMPVSVQRGTGSGEFLSVAAGDTASAPVVVRQASGGTGAVHVGFGLAPQLPAGFRGLEVVPGEEMVLFAESGNGSPVIRTPVPAHRLQVDGPSAEVVLRAHFVDPDGDSLSYEVVTGDGRVAGARIEDGALWMDPGLEGTTEVQVTAADSGGLRAAQRVEVAVGPAPDPDAFNIEVMFGPGFTEAQQDSIRMAADRWMEVVTGDLPDVPIDGYLDGYCADHIQGPRLVGRIDDLVIRMHLRPRDRRVIGTARICGARAESGLAFYGASWYSGVLHSPPYSYGWYETALHEIGHVLGIGYWVYSSSPEAWRELFRDRDTDPHFAGALAVEAFDAAGGEGYTGGKVPVEDRIHLAKGSHWRASVIPGDIMSVGTRGRVLTAITVQALADMGHGVDVSRSDPYTLPSQVQGDVAGGAAEAEGGVAEVLVDEIVEGPVVVVDKDGKVVRVIRR